MAAFGGRSGTGRIFPEVELDLAGELERWSVEQAIGDAAQLDLREVGAAAVALIRYQQKVVHVLGACALLGLLAHVLT